MEKYDTKSALKRHLTNGTLEPPPHFQDRRHELMEEMIDEAGRYITSILDLDTLFWEVTRYVREIFNGYGAVIGFVEGDEVVLRVSYGENGQHDICRQPIDSGSTAAYVINNNIPLISSDLLVQPGCHEIASLHDAQILVAQPIVGHNDRVLGMIAVFDDSPDVFTEDDLVLMGRLAEHVVGAIVNAQLLAKQQVETWGSAILLRVARMFSGLREQDELAYTVLGLALDLTGAEHGILFVFNEQDDSAVIETSNENVKAVVDALGEQWQQDITAQLRNLKQLQISYIHYASEALSTVMNALDMEVTMHAPIRVDEHTWGVIGLGYISAHRFTRYDFNLVAGLAAQAAAAIENTRLLKKVEDEQSYLQAVIANTNEGLFLVNPDGRLNYCNARLEELIGVRYSDMIGESYEGLFREIASLGDASADVHAQLDRALDNLTHQPSVHLMTAYPLSYHLQIGLFPILGDDSQSIGWGGIIRDVTAEWSEIAQRTAQINNATHEMRTSLATMKGFITTLLTSHRYWGEREREEFLLNLDGNVNTLMQLLENIQDLYQLEAGEMELDPQPTEIAQVLPRVLRYPTLVSLQDRFLLSLDETLPTAEIDARRIEQVLRNLMTIALNYSPVDGKVQVNVREMDQTIRFQIVTRGIIPEEHLTYIYDQFYDKEYTAEMMKGPGLGLIVARGIIKGHGGRIWADQANHGTTISFVLPLQAQQAATRLLPMKAAAERASVRPPQKQIRTHNNTNSMVRVAQQALKALVIEDDPYMVRLLKINLESEGFQVFSATRGATAIDLANSEQPDIILLDVRLPDTSGFEICERIREFNKVVPIIMITGKATEDDVVRGLQLGADDYMIKPLSQKELMARMQTLLQRSWMTGNVQTDPIFQNGGITIDFAQRQVTAHGEPVKLTPTEYKLLHNMAVNVGRVLTHEQLLLEVWGPGCEHQTQYLWVNISRLRSKLELDPNAPEYIVTEQGIGYMMPRH